MTFKIRIIHRVYFLHKATNHVSEASIFIITPLLAHTYADTVNLNLAHIARVLVS